MWPSLAMHPRRPRQTTDLADSPAPLSTAQLKARAVRWLATREHTRAELAQKLGRLSDDAQRVVSVLDELARGGWQSDERFAESFVRRQSARQGSAVIAQAMRQKGVSADLIEQARAALAGTELARARAIWQKRFGAAGLPVSRQDYARQGRFLMGRGFSAEVIRQVLASGFGDDDPLTGQD